MKTPVSSQSLIPVHVDDLDAVDEVWTELASSALIPVAEAVALAEEPVARPEPTELSSSVLIPVAEPAVLPGDESQHASSILMRIAESVENVDPNDADVLVVTPFPLPLPSAPLPSFPMPADEFDDASASKRRAALLSLDAKAEATVADEVLAVFERARSGVDPEESKHDFPLAPPSSASILAVSERFAPLPGEDELPSSLSPFSRGAAPSSSHAIATLPRPITPPHVATATPPAAVTSITPVAVGTEPRLIVQRSELPRGWLIASAVVGAIAAVVAMQVTPLSGPPHPAAPAAAVAAPPSEGEEPPVAPSAVVRFSDSDTVSIPALAPAGPPAPPHSVSPVPVAVVPVVHPPHPAVVAAPPAAPAAPHPAPVFVAPVQHAAAKPGAPPPPVRVAPPAMLPDGTLGLSNTSKPTNTAPVSKPTPLPVPPKRTGLTPAQELAEEQLRAAAK